MTSSLQDAAQKTAVLSFTDLDVKFGTEFGVVHAVKGISFEVRAGEVLALVGESGSGKSVTSMTALGLLPSNARVTGTITVDGQVVGDLSEKGLRRMRGNDVAMVFQEPMTALNPVLTIGTQLTEGLELHGIAYGRAASKRAIELLDMVGIPNPERRMKQFPHELSGGCAPSRTSSTPASFSSRTTWALSPIWPTASQSCSRVRSSKWARPTSS